MGILYRKSGLNDYILISDIHIQIIIKFNTANAINKHLKIKNSPRLFNLKYALIDVIAPN